MTVRWIGISSLLLGLGVACGAFGAHALKDRLDPYLLSVFEKGVHYHLVHAAAMLALATFLAFLTSPLAGDNGDTISAETVSRTLALLMGGIVIFSGSLYLLAVTDMRWLGAITPVGGTLFIAAWCYLAVKTLWR